MQAFHLKGARIAALLAEIDDRLLRETVLQRCVAATQADDHVADGEVHVPVRVAEPWGMRGHVLPEPSRPQICPP